MSLFAEPHLSNSFNLYLNISAELDCSRSQDIQFGSIQKTQALYNLTLLAAK